MPLRSVVRCALFSASEGEALTAGGKLEAGAGTALMSFWTAGGVLTTGAGSELLGASLRQAWPASSIVGSAPMLGV